jgi:hypothetical protein
MSITWLAHWTSAVVGGTGGRPGRSRLPPEGGAASQGVGVGESPTFLCMLRHL